VFFSVPYTTANSFVFETRDFCTQVEIGGGDPRVSGVDDDHTSRNSKHVESQELVLHLEQL